jgi:redox-sensitive bicupin YhaK (pirin superfamily)
VTYVLDGALEHEDNAGHRGVIRPGMVQRMSAGTGVVHSEYNASQTDPVHFLQIWIVPATRGVPPRYDDRTFPAAGRENALQLIVSPDGADDSLDIHQDARIYSAVLAPGRSVAHALAPGRHGWVQVARGTVLLNNVPLSAGDGAAISEETALTVAATDSAEVLLFDLA